MIRALIILVLVAGLLIETALRMIVFLAIALTLFGLMFLCWKDTIEQISRPALLPFLTQALEAP